jgi:hypothetical protein
VPQGVTPPAQFIVVPPSTRRAPVARPSRSKVIDEAPPFGSPGTSEFDTRIQPPSAVGKQPEPSLNGCHV